MNKRVELCEADHANGVDARAAFIGDDGWLNFYGSGNYTLPPDAIPALRRVLGVDFTATVLEQMRDEVCNGKLAPNCGCECCERWKYAITKMLRDKKVQL